MLEGADIDALIRMFEQSGWKELELNIGGSDIFLSKTTTGHASWTGRAKALAAPPPPPAQNSKEIVAAAVPTTEREKAVSAPAGCDFVRAPSLGTFFRAAKPGAAPFVEIGHAVSADTELCLIEVMKLFTTLRSGIAGTIVEVLAKDGDLVEFGQPLFTIKIDD